MLETYTDRAFIKLKSICNTRIYDKYDMNICGTAYKQLEKELEYIQKQGSAPLLVVVYEALCETGAKSDDYWICGAMGSSLISYLLDLSKIDPLTASPKLYDEFCYGFSGERDFSVEIRTTKKIYRSLVRCFEHYSGEVSIKHRHFSNGKIIGVSIIVAQGDDGADMKEYEFNFLSVTKPKLTLKRLMKSTVFEIVMPETYEDQIKCMGLEHGRGVNGVWENNMEDLLKTGTVPLSDLIAHREDVYEFLMNHGIEKEQAYKITEDVRRGIVRRKGWDQEYLSILKNAEIPVWFIESCEKIQYLFPRAHDMNWMNYLNLRITYCL